MSKPANKKRGEVAIPELGDGFLVRFTVDALERLESDYGDKWLEAVLEGLADTRPSMIKKCIEVAAVGDKTPDFSDVHDLDAVRSALYDALFLILYGRTFEEQREVEEQKQIEETKKKVKLLTEHPELLSLYSSQSEESATELDSDPTKSESSPQ